MRPVPEAPGRIDPTQTDRRDGPVRGSVAPILLGAEDRLEVPRPRCEGAEGHLQSLLDLDERLERLKIEGFVAEAVDHAPADGTSCLQESGVPRLALHSQGCRW